MNSGSLSIRSIGGRPPWSRLAGGEEFDYGSRIDFLVDRESDVFASVFIDDAADLDRLSKPSRIKLEIPSHTPRGYCPAGASRRPWPVAHFRFLRGSTRRPSSRQRRRKVSRHIP